VQLVAALALSANAAAANPAQAPSTKISSQAKTTQTSPFSLADVTSPAAPLQLASAIGVKTGGYAVALCYADEDEVDNDELYKDTGVDPQPDRRKPYWACMGPSIPNVLGFPTESHKKNSTLKNALRKVGCSASFENPRIPDMPTSGDLYIGKGTTYYNNGYYPINFYGPYAMVVKCNNLLRDGDFMWWSRTDIRDDDPMALHPLILDDLEFGL